MQLLEFSPQTLKQLETRLWEAADDLRANSSLSAQQYSTPVLGLIFLRYAEARYLQAKALIEAEEGDSRFGPDPGSGPGQALPPEAFQARGVMVVPEEALYTNLQNLPEGADLGRALNDAMKAIERANPVLKDVLPKTYQRVDNSTLASLLKTIGWIPVHAEGDAFGQIYEYFLGKFALFEGRGGGEFFTPTSIVKLIVEVIEPFRGRVFDPACGSGGMFVQSAKFVREHAGSPGADLSIYGQEKTSETVRLAKMNLAVHGLEGEIREGNAYYEDLHKSTGRFDFVMANPPFNVNKVDKSRLKDDPRFPLGMPSVDNANYLWIQLFASSLKDGGRAGFVMANSAADARGSEQSIRQKLIEDGVVDVIVSVAPNFFYTVTLPVTLWFFDKGKRGTAREDRVLFINGTKIFRQINQAQRDFTEDQVTFLGNIVRLYRNEAPEDVEALAKAGERRPAWGEAFPDGTYRDVPGLCKAATRAEIEAQGWSLNPGRYVGLAERDEEEFDFATRLEELNEELETLNAEARGLEEQIAENVVLLLENATTDAP